MEGLLQTEDSALRRNSAFCLGVICEFVPSLPTVQRRLMEILKGLHALIMENPENMREAQLCARDNAIAATGRILRGCQASVPLDEVVPLFLYALPLRADFDESEGVLKTLLHLCYGSIAEKHQELLLRGIVGELVNGSVSKSTRNQAKSVLQNCVKNLGSDHPFFAAIARTDARYEHLLRNIGSN